LATKIYGLIGYPVKHSLSRVMHNAAFRALGIDAQYELFEISPKDLGNFFKAVSEKKIRGFNVTIPHKENVLSFVDDIPESVKVIGAANTVKVYDDGRLGCLNTDGEGFSRHIHELGFSFRDKNVIIFGAGGAAKAISYFIAKDLPKKIFIYDIDMSKANTTATNLSLHFSSVGIVAEKDPDKLQIRNVDVLINATPIGMKENDPCLVVEDDLHAGMLVYDIIYNQKETKLLQLAKKKGTIFTNGLKMLLYQGMFSFEFWTGQKAPEKVMWEALCSNL